MASRLVRWGALAAAILVLLMIPVLVVARPYLGAVLGLGLGQEQAASLVELSSIEDLRARFNADEGSPRLVLLLAPT